ncbi:MAG: glutamine--tRNA ligase, partial [Clostridiales Family XIII bacterium]|nr:glutamine--tRNA ligase [Clostridiales Family XIII bacterium]
GLNFTERKVKGTIHFVDAKNYRKITVNELDYLFIKNEIGDFIYNENSIRAVTAFAERSIDSATFGECFQFFRKGYYFLDTFSDTEEEKVFNSTVSLKSSYKI